MKKVMILMMLVWMLGCADSGKDAKALFEDGKYDEAIAIYDSQLESGRNLEVQYNRARAYEEKGDRDKAESEYTIILQSDPEYLPAKLSLAKIAYEKKEYARSVMLSGDALNINDNSAMAHYLQARAKHQMGYTESAMDGYNSAISIDKDFGEAYLYRGALRQALKKKNACEDFRTAEILKVDGATQARKKFCK